LNAIDLPRAVLRALRLIEAHGSVVRVDARRIDGTDSVAAIAGEGAPRLADGTLAGSVLTMDSAVSNVVHRSGVSLADAVQAASANPARLLGLADRGAITPGRRADLVMLRNVADNGWEVDTVWVGGAVAWPPT